MRFTGGRRCGKKPSGLIWSIRLGKIGLSAMAKAICAQVESGLVEGVISGTDVLSCHLRRLLVEVLRYRSVLLLRRGERGRLVGPDDPTRCACISSFSLGRLRPERVKAVQAQHYLIDFGARIDQFMNFAVARVSTVC
jgi:hypothetical protein